MIKAVIFDFNGVIVDDEALHDEAFVSVWKKEMGIILTDDDLEKLIIGRTDREGMQNIAEKYGVPADIDYMIEQKKLGYQKLATDLQPQKGLIELLNKISGKVKIGLVTSALRLEVLRIMDLFNLGNYFEAVITGEDVEKGKPHPEPYLNAAKALGVRPDECIVIEDSPVGIWSAKNAGMYCVAIRTKVFNASELYRADKMVNSLNEIKIEEFL